MWVASSQQPADARTGLAAPAAVAIGSAIVAALGGVALLQLIATRIDRFGTGFLAASGTRILVGLLMCFVTAQVLALKGPTVWYCFLGAAMLGLLFETAWAVRINAKLVSEHASLTHAAGVAS